MLSFHFVYGFFCCANLVSLIRAHLFIFAFISFSLGDWAKKILLQFMLENVLPMVSSRSFMMSCFILWGFPGGSDGKESACNVGDPDSIPGLGRSPGEGNGYPLQYSCLENPMDRERSLAGYSPWVVFKKKKSILPIDLFRIFSFNVIISMFGFW